MIESVADGLKVYDDPAGVLTNNPPFPQQMFALNNFMHLSPKQPENLFSDALPLTLYSRGMGALGLPGDLSSASRFVRAAFTRLHSVSGEGEADSVGQFFHILGAVEQQNGCCEVRPGEYERTIYTSCWNADRGIYYYTTYTNRRISAVELRREDLDAAALIRYPMRTREDIFYQNAPGTESEGPPPAAPPSPAIFVIFLTMWDDSDKAPDKSDKLRVKLLSSANFLAIVPYKL